MKKILTIMMLSGIIFLSACSSPTTPSTPPPSQNDSGNPSSSNPQQSTNPSSPSAGLIDACALVPQSDIESLFGGKYQAQTNTILQANNDALDQKSGDCKLTDTSGKGYIYFVVFVGNDQSTTKGMYSASRTAVDNGQVMQGVKTNDVSGIGDSAYSYTYKSGPGFSDQNVNLVVLSGTKYLNIDLTNQAGDESKQLDIAKTFANKLLPAL